MNAMKRTTLSLLILLMLLAVSSSCTHHSTGNPSDTPSFNYFPLGTGYSWEYENFEEVQGEWRSMSTTRRRILESTVYDGVNGYHSVDSTWNSGRVSGRYTLRRNEDSNHLITTTFFEPVTDGDYGSWYDIYHFDVDELGSTWRESSGHDGSLAYWSLDDAAASVTVPAGTFHGCIVNSYRSLSNAHEQIITYYFALGVGEVLEVTENWRNGELIWHVRRELTSYSFADSR